MIVRPADAGDAEHVASVLDESIYARVRPGATGRGVGSALLRELEARAAHETGVSLTSWPRDERAARLLRQWGYLPPALLPVVTVWSK